jgi:hypothetical protein
MVCSQTGAEKQTVMRADMEGNQPNIHTNKPGQKNGGGETNADFAKN